MDGCNCNLHKGLDFLNGSEIYDDDVTQIPILIQSAGSVENTDCISAER